MENKLVVLTEDFSGLYKLKKVMDTGALRKSIAIDSLNVGSRVPYGTVAMSYSKDDEKEEAYYVVLRGRRKGTMTWSSGRRGDMEYFNVMWPPMCFTITHNVKAQKVIKLKAHMLKPNIVSVETLADAGTPIDLYGLPLPNLYEDHKVCIPPETFRRPGDVIANFYESSWNSDLDTHIFDNRGRLDSDESGIDVDDEEVSLKDIILEAFRLMSLDDSQEGWNRVGRLVPPGQDVVLGDGTWTIIQSG